MPFQNNVVAGTTLVRDSIHSPLFQSGVQGWSINKDGTAEFNDLIVRGSISTGFPPDARITIDDNLVLSSPAIAFYDGVNADPAFIVGVNDGTQATLTFMTGHVAGIGTDGVTMDLSTSSFSVATETTTLGFVSDFDPDPEVGGFFVLHTGGVIPYLAGGTTPQAVNITTDGKIFTGSPVSTTSASTTDVAVTSANLVNTPLIADRAYLVTYQVAVSSTVANDRITFKIWDGTVGITQLGAAVNKRVQTTNETVQLMFIFRAGTTGVISNINLSMNRLSGTGTTATLIDANFLAVCVESGFANNIGSL